MDRFLKVKICKNLGFLMSKLVKNVVFQFLGKNSCHNDIVFCSCLMLMSRSRRVASLQLQNLRQLLESICYDCRCQSDLSVAVI